MSRPTAGADVAGWPYRIDGPALISFSGGRTSGFMLRHILDVHGGQLPDDVHVVFFNTGREMEETLRFVHECGTRWTVRITWLEFDLAAEHHTAVVGYNSASRAGEPFAAVIRQRQILPNPTARTCTQYLKIKRGIAFMRDMLGYDTWVNVVGLRADEPRRVARMRAANEAGRERFETILPLSDAKVSRHDVAAFWRRQPFDLALPNAKGRATIMGIMRLFPERAAWWMGQEAHAPGLGTMRRPEMALFRADRPSYAAMFAAVRNQADIEDIDDDGRTCGWCHD